MKVSEPAANATVLLVDDEPQHLELRAGVMSLCGFSVTTAGEATEARPR